MFKPENRLVPIRSRILRNPVVEYSNKCCCSSWFMVYMNIKRKEVLRRDDNDGGQALR